MSSMNVPCKNLFEGIDIKSIEDKSSQSNRYSIPAILNEMDTIPTPRSTQSKHS